MKDALFSTEGSRRTILLGILAAACAAGVLGWAVFHTFSSDRTRPAVRHVCESCRHEWDEPLGIEPACPKCGRTPLLETSFCCPKCRHVWVGLQRRKLGPGKFQYRLPDTEAWLVAAPEKLTCPGCSHASAEIYRHALPAGTGGKPPTTGPARRDYE